MAENENDKQTPKKRRRFWKNPILWIVLIALVLFHRPLFFEFTRYFIVRAAHQQKLDLEYEIDGSIFTTLQIKNLKAIPTEPGPVQHLEIGTLNLRYNIWGLMREGLPGFLQALEGDNIHIKIIPKIKPKEKRNRVKFPALFPQELLLTRVHFSLPIVQLEDLNLRLPKDKPGYLEINRVTLHEKSWEKIQAPASYYQRNLFIHNLSLGNDIRTSILNVDASGLENSILKLVFDAQLFGGTAAMAVEIQDLNKDNRITASAVLKNIDLQSLSGFLNTTTLLDGELTGLTLQFRGPVEEPNLWDAKLLLQAKETLFGNIRSDQIVLKATVVQGKTTFEFNEFAVGLHSMRLAGNGMLPPSIREFSKTNLDGTFSFETSDLGTLANADALLQGTVTATAPFTLKDQTFSTTLDIALADFSSNDLSLTQAALKVELEKKEIQKLFNVKKDDKQNNFTARLLDNLKLQSTGSFEALRQGNYFLEKGTLEIEGTDDRFHLKQFTASTASNQLTVTGSYSTSEKEPVLDAKFSVSAPTLAEFAPDINILAGLLNAEGQIHRENKTWSGNITASGEKITFKELETENLAANISIADNRLNIDTFRLNINDKSYATATGHIILAAPYDYEGTIDAILPDLSMFEPLLVASDNPTALGGSISLAWKGKGNFEKQQHTGDLNLKLTDGIWGDSQNLSSEISGTYSPELINFPVFKFQTPFGQFTTVITLENRQLNIRELTFRDNDRSYLTGEIGFPLDLRNPTDKNSLFPPDGPISANIIAKDLTLEQFQRDTPAIQGAVSGSIVATGTLRNPNIQANLKAEKLITQATKNLTPATVDLKMELNAEQLLLDGSLIQPEIQPLTIRGNLPFSLGRVLRHGSLSEQAPVSLSITLPKSSLAFLSKLSPEIRYAEGDISIDSKIEGTIANPKLSGAINLAIPAIRFTNPNAPSINNIDANLTFAENTLNINRFSGNLSGGTVALNGTVKFEKLTAPVLALHLTSNNALVKRNETLTLRLSSDIKIEGPLESATASGNLQITNSRFFREIDILPIQLPGRPAPKPPRRTAGFSFQNPPFRDWKFDINITTHDPFLVRGNLAYGSVFANVKLLGDGSAPTLDGTLRIADLTASLPFSKLNITHGFVYFNPDNPFIPQLDIRGTSTIRDYKINVYVYGESSSPETLFTSEPPLPQEDIISLVATGTTPSELTGNSDVLAGRAAVLVFQKLYRKVFNKTPEQDPSNGSFLDRFDISVGAVDPKTGRQEIEARFEMSEHLYLIGDLDVQGDVRGQVKYLIRFR